MIILAEIDKDGAVKVQDPDLFGKTILLSSPASLEDEFARKTDWESIKSIVHSSANLDFPRRDHEEIIRDLHDLQG